MNRRIWYGAAPFSAQMLNASRLQPFSGYTEICGVRKYLMKVM